MAISYKEALLKNTKKPKIIPKFETKTETKIRIEKPIPQNYPFEFLANFDEKPKEQKNILQKKHPPKLSIIKRNSFYYEYVGSYHQSAKQNGIQEGKNIDAGGIWTIQYRKDHADYMYVRALFLYEDRFYTIPAYFSEIGTMDPTSDWVFIQKKPNYRIVDLDNSICEKVCPGYLD